jgi:presenilin-like A22 family membrane protease
LACLQLQGNMPSHTAVSRPILLSSRGSQFNNIFGSLSVVILKMCSYQFYFCVRITVKNKVTKETVEIFESASLRILLYGSESWTVKGWDVKEIQSTL